MFGTAPVGVDGAWMEGLNLAQREAVAHGEGPLLIVAGAGSGKTWTLACRVAHLVQRGVPPERILLLTFTRRAAAEMLARAAQLSARDSLSRVWGGTFHAVGNRLLRVYGRSLGLSPSFTVMDQADAADLMNLVRNDLGLASRERRFPRKETLVSIYSRTVNAGQGLSVVLEKHFPWCSEHLETLRTLFEGYTRRKREQDVLDYDDLLLYWHALMRAPSVGDEVAGLFDHVLVDEYQDTNALQAEILRGLRKHNPNITVVGDDAQAIYSFRAATVHNILQFGQHFPGARIVKLEQNYRSTQPILDVSNAVIALSPQRHEKALWTEKRQGARPALVTCVDEAEQCAAVCRQVLEHREQGVRLRKQAVLFRASHHSDLLEVELARRNIPFVKYGGLKFLEAAHVKDALCLLRVLENPHDEVSWFRVLQLLEGIGPASARRTMEALHVRRTSEASGQPLATLFANPPAVPAAAREGFAALRAALADCAGWRPAEAGGPVEPPPPASQVERLRRFLEPVVHRLYNSPPSRLRDLEQLESIAARYPNRGRFIAELTLDPPQSTGDLAGEPLLDEDWLVLSTVHSAKGAEWDVVHVIHAADGMFPSDMATGDRDEIEEERRLFYVALTRARDWLYVYFPLRYYHRPRGLDDAHGYAQLTRFLPPGVREKLEQRAASPAAVAPPDPATATASVDQFLANLWNG